MNINQMKTRSIKDIVYKLIKKDILKGKFKPGKRLVEQQLSKKFDVSRTPLREAFQKLEAEGLVTRINSGGVKVSKLSEKEIKDIYDVRKSLECMIVKEVSQCWQEKELERLEEIVENIQNNLKYKKKIKNDDEKNIIQSIKNGNKFHEQLYKIYNNQVCINILKGFQAQIDRYAFLALSYGERNLTSSQEHIKLFNLIKERRSNEAKKLMKKHILSGQKITVRRLRMLHSK